MGSWTETQVGTGRDREEAWDNVCSAYRDEYGYSHSIREVVLGTLIRKVPPIKEVRTTTISRWGNNVTIRYEEDPSAPQSEWLEEWRFEFWVHA